MGFLRNTVARIRAGLRPDPIAPRTWAILVVVLVAGVVLAVYAWPAASLAEFVRYRFGDTTESLPTGHLAAALTADVGLVAGAALVLAACSVVIARLSTTPGGARFGRIALGCTAGAVAADVLENLGVFTRAGAASGSTVDAVLRTAVATAATLKWSMLIVAVIAVPAAVTMIAIRAKCVHNQKISRQNLIVLTKNDNIGQWWTECHQQPEQPPGADNTDQRDQWAWSGSYNVPGAAAVLEARGNRPVQAVCLSGGGVRSASVAMGALQTLSRARPFTEIANGKSGTGEKYIDTVDYVISVSGGGYTAGARLLACKSVPGDDALNGLAPTSTEPGPEGGTIRISERFGEGSVEFDHVRRHSSYIADSLPGLLRALAYVLRNLLASMVILFWTPVALGLVAGSLYAYLPIAALTPVAGHFPLGTDTIGHTHAWCALGLVAALAVLLLAAALLVEVLSFSKAAEECRGRVLVSMHSVVLVGVVIAVLLVGLPALMWLCANLPGTDVRSGRITATAAGVLGLQYLSALAAMAWRHRARVPRAKDRTRRRILPAGVVPYLLTMVTLAVLTVAWLAVLGSVGAGVFGRLTSGEGGSWLWLLYAVAAGLVVGAFCLADVTSLSLHPFYRWRLANTFAVRRGTCEVTDGGQASTQPCAQTYPASEPTWLHTHGAVERGPKFVFSAAAAISGEGKPAPGLNAVSFVLSSDYLGGPDLGWLKTDRMWAACPPRLKRDLTVQAAVAVSGAAFASTMGRQNKGFQTLLAVSGARLGTWLPNPRQIAALCERIPRGSREAAGQQLLTGLPSVRGFSYFYRELLGRHSRDARLVQVTDGGHYENLGLVEALRRRARVIVCIDGGGDTPPLLSGLADAMRLARSELGVKIDLDDADDDDFALQHLTPGSGAQFPEDNAFALLNSRITKGTVVCGRITYPAASGLSEDQRHGLLILAKAVLWERCPDWLLTYAGTNPVFPHDSTSDQWFTEAQFAAYTELGRILGCAVVQAYNANLPAGLARLVLEDSACDTAGAQPPQPVGARS
ncbi:hypothetical protein ACQI4F_24650 [Mycolicibacterium vaccae]|uniref:hypothetical protein n=1 Tax=Mycolicibacterium vaccae TaxID=1810 RepID=UPI003CF1E2AC